MLPGMNGFDVLRKIRESSKLPVIMLTARGDDIDRIVGLELGAQRMNDMIGQLLSLTRLGNGTSELQRVEFDLCALLSGLVQVSLPASSSKSLG